MYTLDKNKIYKVRDCAMIFPGADFGRLSQIFRMMIAKKQKPETATGCMDTVQGTGGLGAHWRSGVDWKTSPVPRSIAASRSSRTVMDQYAVGLA